MEQRKSKLALVKRFALCALALPIVATALVAIGAFQLLKLLWGLSLGVLVRVWWIPRGRYGVVVYSDSPTWKTYFESEALPKVGQRLAVLNWSERRTWTSNPFRKPLALWIFHRWAGEYEFNPIAVVFVPWWRPRVLRFWKPFKDFKHGKPQKIIQLESEMLSLLPSGA